MAGIYIHIPFCKQACHYCDFHFSTYTKLKAPLLQALAHELVLQQDYLENSQVNSIYFGGGTPSMLEVSEIETLLIQISKYFCLSKQAEITLEANPDDITLDKLIALKGIGINRLSMGVQTFQDPLLSFLHRVHDRAKALKSIDLVLEAGFANFSIDLIYGIPGQTEAMWQEDLLLSTSFGLPHIAAYCLTIETKTVFGRWQQQGKLQPIDEETAARQFECLVDTLLSHQYEHYEISNFCLPGRYAQHNSHYWKQGKYLGIGPSAHSYNGISRHYNIAKNHLYLQSIQQDTLPRTLEVLDRKNHTNEYIMTSLRTQWGCDINLLHITYQYDIQQTKSAYLVALVDQGLATLQNNTLVLTTRGKLLADQIALDLFVA